MKLSVVSYFLLLLITAMTYSNAQDMNPEAAKFYNEGSRLLKAGDFNAAIVQFDSALNVEQDFRIYYQKGITYRKAGNLDSAKTAIESSIKLKPDFEGAYNALGSVFFSMKNYQDAAANFEKTIQMTQDSSVKSSAMDNLGVAYTMLGNEEVNNKNYQKAIELLEKAVGNNISYDRAYLLLAKAYSETKDFDKTIAASENALKYKKSISEGGPYYYLGLAYKGKGDNAKAKEMFNTAKTDDAYKKAAEYELKLL